MTRLVRITVWLMELNTLHLALYRKMKMLSGLSSSETFHTALIHKRLELSAPNVGSRVFMMADETHYQLFDLLNKEFSFEVDTSTLGCGYNGALYFVSMDADGGVARFPANKAGAKYGTGYCDAQCSQYNKFIDGTVLFAPISYISHANPLDRPIVMAGLSLKEPTNTTTPTLGSDTTAPAALKWMSGWQTACPPHFAPCRAQHLVKSFAWAMLA